MPVSSRENKTMISVKNRSYLDFIQNHSNFQQAVLQVQRFLSLITYKNMICVPCFLSGGVVKAPPCSPDVIDIIQKHSNSMQGHAIS